MVWLLVVDVELAGEVARDVDVRMSGGGVPKVEYVICNM